MSPLAVTIPGADPTWAEPLLRLLPAVATAITLDRLILAIANRRARAKGKQGARRPRSLPILRPWLTATTGNLLGWLAVLLLMPLIWTATSGVPAALTAHPIKQWYLHLRLRSLEDVIWLTGAILIPTLAMHATTWAATRRRRPPTLWLIPAFATAEFAAMLTAATLTRLLG